MLLDNKYLLSIRRTEAILYKLRRYKIGVTVFLFKTRLVDEGKLTEWWGTLCIVKELHKAEKT